MKIAQRVFSIIVVAAAALASHIYTATFDELTPPGQMTDYGGLTWVNVAYEASSSIPATGLRSLFKGNVIYSTGSNAEVYTTGAGQAKIHSIEIASRQAASLSVTIQGLRNNNIVFTKTVTVYNNKVTKVNIGVFLQHIRVNQAGVVMDNVVFSTY
jgi:hypothetical protein